VCGNNKRKEIDTKVNVVQ